MKRFVTMLVLMVVVFSLVLTNGVAEDGWYTEAQVGVVISQQVTARMSADSRTESVAKLTNGTHMCVVGKTTGYFEGEDDEFYIVTGDSIGLPGFGYVYVAADFVYLGCPEMIRMTHSTKCYAGLSRDCKAVGTVSEGQERIVLEKHNVNGEIWYSIQIDADSRGCAMVPSTDVSAIFYRDSDRQLEASYRGALGYTYAAEAVYADVTDVEEETYYEEPVNEEQQVAEQPEAPAMPAGGGNFDDGDTVRALCTTNVYKVDKVTVQFQLSEGTTDIIIWRKGEQYSQVMCPDGQRGYVLNAHLGK